MLPTVIPRRYPALSAFALEYRNADFIGDKVFPIIESETKDIRYGSLDKLNMFQNIDDALARDGEANEVGFSAGLKYAMMNDYALKTTISRETTADAESFLNVAMDQVAILTAVLALRREYRQANLLYSKLVSASRNAAGGNWADYSSSAPDIVNIIRNKRNNALYAYDTLVVPKQVYIWLERAPSLVNQWFVGNTGTKILDKKQVAECLGFKEENILIPDARLASAKRPTSLGDTDLSSLDRIWGPHVFLLRTSKTIPNRAEPGCAYQYRRRWTKGVVGDNMQTRAWYIPHKGIGGSDVVQTEYQSLDMVLAPEMGYVFTNCLTAA